MRRLRRAVAPIDAWVMAVQAVFYPYPPGRRLRAIADWINANPVLGLRAACESHSVSTARKPAGLRYITHPGKGRDGTRLRVVEADAPPIRDLVGPALLEHSSAETYRHNFEVERWLADRIAALPAEKRRALPALPPPPPSRRRR